MVSNKQLNDDVCSKSIRRYSSILINGLVRVKGRLSQDLVGLDEKLPILFSGYSHLTKFIITECHVKSGHWGLNHTFTCLREHYWIEKPCALMRKVINECLVCSQKKATAEMQMMADLPTSRISVHQQPFAHFGVDCFGPIMVKHSRSYAKRYGCLLTCLSSRWMHLEVLHAMTADSFLMAFERFRSRRGQVDHLYSDDGTNFVTAAKALDKQLALWNCNLIDKSLVKSKVQWHFNPPYASHHGASWERLFRSVKSIFLALAPKQAYTDETLLSLFVEIEMILNSRSLTPVKFKEVIEKPLTPNDLLLLKPSSNMTSNLTTNESNFIRSRLIQMKRSADIFWQRWIKEYLSTIAPKTKWLKEKRNLKPEGVVW